MRSLKSIFRSPAPWRDIPEGDNAKYLDDIKKFQLNNDGVQHIRISLYGPTGAGKSSFINSIESALRGRMTGQALADSIGGTSFTKKYKTHKIKKSSGTYYPFVFTDIMGLEKEIKKGVCLEDIDQVLKGHVRDGYEFIPQSAINSANEYFNECPTDNDKTHVFVCVVPATTISLLSNEYMDKVREARLLARELGIPQMAILTKVDEACREVESNIKNVYKSKTIKQKIDELHAFLGLPLNCIFPVKNYHSEIHPNDDIDILILMALKWMINFGEDFVHSIHSN